MKILNVNHLYNLVLACVDMKVSNITIINSESKGSILFNEKTLKYNPNGFTLVHRGEIMFDPLNNFKQAQQLFSVFLQFQEQEGEFYTQMFYDEKNAEDQTRIYLKTDIGNFASNYYYNISLGYIELIFLMSGIMADNLLDFDAPIIPVVQKRRKPLFPVRDLL